MGRRPKHNLPRVHVCPLLYQDLCHAKMAVDAGSVEESVAVFILVDDDIVVVVDELANDTGGEWKSAAKGERERRSEEDYEVWVWSD